MRNLQKSVLEGKRKKKEKTRILFHDMDYSLKFILLKVHRFSHETIGRATYIWNEEVSRGICVGIYCAYIQRLHVCWSVRWGFLVYCTAHEPRGQWDNRLSANRRYHLFQTPGGVRHFRGRCLRKLENGGQWCFPRGSDERFQSGTGTLPYEVQPAGSAAVAKNTNFFQ